MEHLPTLADLIRREDQAMISPLVALLSERMTLLDSLEIPAPTHGPVPEPYRPYEIADGPGCCPESEARVVFVMPGKAGDGPKGWCIWSETNVGYDDGYEAEWETLYTPVSFCPFCGRHVPDAP